MVTGVILVITHHRAKYVTDCGFQLCKSVLDIPWHHTSIRIQQIPESSRINAASAKKRGVTASSLPPSKAHSVRTHFHLNRPNAQS
ncbi:hypothetical protein Q8A67_020242 [Cirrhinus molitorella]|uniref:Uncharacterized protein n=1 Tax=Cirrhinus molitorella TaxID=172907 RepID=A0AA88PBI5_9TELE|nr:hypothetical protein Q8A67_020242 [Cirrhinus molitorella]